MDIVKSYALALLLAFLIESGVEYIFGTPMSKLEKLQPLKWLLMYFSLAAGVGLAFYYQLDLVALITEGSVSIVGMALTGSVVGRGASFVHDVVKQYILKKPA